MIRTTPVPRAHERRSTTTGPLGALVGHARDDPLPDVREVRVLRRSATRPGIFDSSPLYKYRFSGPDAEAFLAGVLARDVRTCDVGHAQYTAWLDDRGFVVEDGVVLRLGPSEFLLTAAEPNLAYFEELVGRRRVTIADETDDWAVLAVQGPRSRGLLADLAPAVADLPYFGLTKTTLAGAGHRLAHGLHGRPGLRDLGPGEGRAPGLGRGGRRPARGQGVIPFGMTALYMARIEAGLLLLDVDFHSSRFAWTDAERTTPLELGLGWMVRDLATTTGCSSGVTRCVASRPTKSSRWRTDRARSSTGASSTGIHDEAGLIPPKDHTPIQDEYYVYDDHAGAARLGDEPDVLADAPAAHRPRARAARPYAKPGSPREARAAGQPPLRVLRRGGRATPLYNPERRTA